MTGGGKYLKKSIKSRSYLFETLNHVKLFQTYKIFKRSSSGSILIEFAVCMPVLIILLYYINDLLKLKRYYDQSEFMAQQMVNILQNISQNRENIAITLTDLKYACHLASLSMYPGTTMLYKNGCSDLGHFPRFTVQYIKGESGGTASWKWMVDFPGAVTSPTDRTARASKTTQSAPSFVKRATKVPPSEIHPLLKINPGESKIIVEVSLLHQPGTKTTQGHTTNSANEVFNMKMYKLTPQKALPEYNGYWYFFSNVIFTPKSGLFSETPPK